MADQADPRRPCEREQVVAVVKERRLILIGSCHLLADEEVISKLDFLWHHIAANLQQSSKAYDYRDPVLHWHMCLKLTRDMLIMLHIFWLIHEKHSSALMTHRSALMSVKNAK